MCAQIAPPAEWWIGTTVRFNASSCATVAAYSHLLPAMGAERLLRRHGWGDGGEGHEGTRNSIVMKGRWDPIPTPDEGSAGHEPMGSESAGMDLSGAGPKRNMSGGLRRLPMRRPPGARTARVRWDRWRLCDTRTSAASDGAFVCVSAGERRRRCTRGRASAYIRSSTQRDTTGAAGRADRGVSDRSGRRRIESREA